MKNGTKSPDDKKRKTKKPKEANDNAPMAKAPVSEAKTVSEAKPVMRVQAAAPMPRPKAAVAAKPVKLRRSRRQRPRSRSRPRSRPRQSLRPRPRQRPRRRPHPSRGQVRAKGRGEVRVQVERQIQEGCEEGRQEGVEAREGDTCRRDGLPHVGIQAAVRGRELCHAEGNDAGVAGRSRARTRSPSTASWLR